MAQARKHTKQNVAIVIMACAVLIAVIVCCTGVNIASASLFFNESQFGLSDSAVSASSNVASLEVPQLKSAFVQDAQEGNEAAEVSTTQNASTGGAGAAGLNNGAKDEQQPSSSDIMLTRATSRDITAGVNSVNAKHEAERIAAEEAARAETEAKQAEIARKRNSSNAIELGELSDVDWSVGRDAFIAEWTDRINIYLSGSPLGGYGEVFATAAWENAVDPRWSPAISHTESTNGRHCFLSHNAWGWGSSSWGSWEEAINAHVSGLAESYGYTVSLSNAKKYCPPNYQHWYDNTVAQMRLI